MTGAELADELRARNFLEPVEIIAASHHVTLDEIASDSHMQHVSRARQAAMRLMKRSGLSYPAIGRILRRHHSTVMSGVKRVET